MKSKSKTTKNIDWRITSTRKPSKKWISYLKKTAKIQKDIQLKKDKDKASKELTNLKYRATLQDIKDYSKGSYYPINKYPNVFALQQMFIMKVIKSNPTLKKVFLTKPKKKKTVKPKTKTKTVKKTKTTKKTKSKKKKTTSKKKK